MRVILFFVGCYGSFKDVKFCSLTIFFSVDELVLLALLMNLYVIFTVNEFTLLLLHLVNTSLAKLNQKFS